ncbi:MAG TPA: 3-phosphoshikimate 1-carboxyvinyltransferase [Methanotrichaceae archaeon]|nr:MAG: 3-phosphoshikimate 1-carboxyvinyltransferase [Methanosaeta sp. PtaU1.Bin028]HOT07815.1 3-phosphoshikimate 1-carboxyvinyltransferase [Methanotrichaceae archaeon]HQF17552.1 3-phosphoshikimate 1-carboxyvinyltransferase [Methanotrichaceae archaeon]HQI92106.1 3-phosphoshikimate 1-carboxyvinyltransferase [Methanotrichaceae archaeon]HQJ29366.1 3-phosphoshikimate 1-carboxyvinyltransferase [Methanotrichaceae archaeon]
MIASVDRSQISGQVFVPPSKSYTHRAILITALGEGGKVHRPLLSADPRATVTACKAIGAEVQEDRGDLVIRGVGGTPCTPEDVIDVMNSGTTLRFIAAVSALTDGAVLTGDSSIRTRPNGPLLDALNQLGAEAFSIRRNGRAPLVVRGRIRGGRAFLDGKVSSQFLSALLIACPLAEAGSEIVIQGELKSRPYAEITLDMLGLAGAHIEEAGGAFRMNGGQSYHLRDFAVPGDFSSASYPLAAGALFGEGVKVCGLFPSRQGDSAILDILRRMGASVSWDRERGEVSVSAAQLRGVEVDASLTPDLVPTVAVLGALAEGRTVIKNAEHVRHKETDRLHAMAVELTKMGASIQERPDGLEIVGGRLHGAVVEGWHDHRIVMALALAAMAAGETKITTAEAVDVSYPGFFQEIGRLGANVSVVS